MGAEVVVRRIAFQSAAAGAVSLMAPEVVVLAVVEVYEASSGRLDRSGRPVVSSGLLLLLVESYPARFQWPTGR